MKKMGTIYLKTEQFYLSVLPMLYAIFCVQFDNIGRPAMDQKCDR